MYLLVAKTMEKRVGVVDVENHNNHTNDSDRFSKSVGSSVKIDSISIELVCNNDLTATEDWGHFSIR